MSIEELKEWFFDRLNNCYPVTNENYPNIIFWYYDEKYIRKTKLCRLSNKEIILPSKISGECLFAHHIKSKIFFNDSEKIWLVFNNEYSVDYHDVQSIIKCWLEEELKMIVYAPIHSSYLNEMLLNEKSIKYVYTPKNSLSTHSWFKKVSIISV